MKTRLGKVGVSAISVIVVLLNVRTMARTSKRRRLTTSNQGLSECGKPKRSRRRLLSESNNDCSGEDISDIVKHPPECSDENIVVTDHVPVKHAVTSKAPISPVLRELRQEFKDKQKVSRRRGIWLDIKLTHSCQAHVVVHECIL